MQGENAEKPSTHEVSGFEGLIGEGFRFQDKHGSGCALGPRSRPSFLEIVEESDNNFQELRNPQGILSLNNQINSPPHLVGLLWLTFLKYGRHSVYGQYLTKLRKGPYTLPGIKLRPTQASGLVTRLHTPKKSTQSGPCCGVN